MISLSGIYHGYFVSLSSCHWKTLLLSSLAHPETHPVAFPFSETAVKYSFYSLLWMSSSQIRAVSFKREFIWVVYKLFRALQMMAPEGQVLFVKMAFHWLRSSLIFFPFCLRFLSASSSRQVAEGTYTGTWFTNSLVAFFLQDFSKFKKSLFQYSIFHLFRVYDLGFLAGNKKPGQELLKI